jgi:D-glycero-alpha-D-manno-heptose 1-phosphate guanylyltransferase
MEPATPPSSAPSTTAPRKVAFLLCGGLGTRLRQVTDQPKAVLDVAGWPFLRYHLEVIRAAGIRRIVFLTGYGAAEVEETFGPASEDRIFLAEPSPLGTGGALARASSWAGSINWIANGDSFVDVAPAAVIEAHRPGVGQIVTVHVEERSGYGGVQIDEAGRILGFQEKGRRGPGWINAGIYLLDRSFLAELPDGVSSLEHDHFPRWAMQGRLVAQRVDVFFRDIGTPERLAAARREFVSIRARMERTRPAGPAR